MRLTTRDWQAFVPVLARRQDFTTSGALWGRAGSVVTTGRLPRMFLASVEMADYVVYSYATPIAWRIAKTGRWVMPAVKYSVTTTRHQNKIATAVSMI